MPDYSIYPDCDYDIGFTTRGCNRNCSFCFVTPKEGKFRIHQHPSEFHDPNHKKIVLLDNNILLDKDWFYKVTDWILEQKMSVDFNQGLDIRLLDQDIANRLKQLKHFKPWHFAFDSLSYKDYVLNGMDMLRNAGINLRSSVIWYVFMNDDTQFDSALERCNILRQNGTMPYPMLNPVNEHTRRMKDLKRWCRPWFFFTMSFDEYKPRGE